MDAVVGAGVLLALVVVTGVLLVRRPRHPVTLVLVVMTSANLIDRVAPGWLENLVWTFAVLPLSMLLVAFPDGPRGRTWTRIFVYLGVAISLIAALSLIPAENQSAVVVAAVAVLAATVVLVAAAAVVSLVRLWLRSTGDRRSRIGLVLAAGALLLSPYVVLPLVSGLLQVLGVDPPLDDQVMDALFLGLMFSLVPIAVGVSMLREPVGHRVAWVDRFWPVLLAAAVALIVGGTVAEVALALGRSPGSPGVVATSALLVAASVAWLPTLMGSSETRQAVGEDRAARAMADLADRLVLAEEADAIPALVASTVGRALGLRGVAIDSGPAGSPQRLGAWGDLDGNAIHTPLVHGGEVVGELFLVPQRDGVPMDLAVLAPLLPAVSATVASARMQLLLDEAHQHVRIARDAERSRLRADLHDELSPSLSGIRLTLHAARDLLGPGNPAAGATPPDPGAHDALRLPPDSKADALLSRADAELARAGGVIRAILDDLQPDPLTADGLVAAVRARAEDFDRPDVFDVSVVAPTPLPVLAPQVEVAVLRVASEAICNSARHSGGSSCRTTLTPDGSGVSLVVRDDGKGIPEVRRHGVGLESMAARTAAAGGSLTIQPGLPTGTVVSAWFPADTASGTAEPAPVPVSAGSSPGGAS